MFITDMFSLALNTRTKCWRVLLSVFKAHYYNSSYCKLESLAWTLW